MKKLILFLAASIIGSAAFSQAPATVDHAKELLELTGSGKIGIQLMNNMMSTFKKQLPTVPTEFWEEASKEFNPKDLIDLVAPVYSKYYTDDELVKLIEFYKTPLGKKVIENLPLISQDSYQLGQEWGRKIGEKVEKRLKEKGYLKTI